MEKNLFNILRELEKNTPIDKLAYACHIIDDVVNTGIESLLKGNYIKNSQKGFELTGKGQSFLQKYKADFAIIMAAGSGDRLNPVTIDTPKPLVKVHGITMIEYMIETLKSAGIDNIYVVTGYKAGMFAFLADKYDDLTLINNDLYKNANNSTTIYTVKDLLKKGKNFYICEADHIVTDPSFLNKYVNQNQYLAKFIAGETDEWTFDVENDRITQIKIGGCNALNMVGITFWLAETAAYLADALEDLYKKNPNAKMLHWDVVLNMHLNDISLGYQEVYPDQIFEIDTFDELIATDNSYLVYNKHGD